ncbi:hypothetical protein KX928_16280 [Roseobacter sp. YSTF-M11]|uniref:Uncharacterized protein n=1 Tax=Roseobacter insulae TaxID=2859783 RepID=A0A9X1JZI8_9RHOB|nr:hypothetical protein [Roseobacter insulae]MBW4709350.1 hypothetical protein [Roseobacter insulae]
MKTLLQLHYRRVMIGALFYGLAAFLMFSGPPNDASLLINLVTTLVFMMIIAVLGFVGVAAFPSFRIVMELGGLVFFASAVFQHSGLAHNADHLPEWLASCAFFIMFAIMHQVVYGTWWQKSGLGLSVRLHSRFDTKLTPAETWAQLVPNEHDPGAYYSKTLRAYHPVPEIPGRYIQKLGLGGSAVLELQIDVTERIPNKRYAYRFHTETSDRNRMFNRGSCVISLTDLGTQGTRVDIREINEKLAVGEALLMWFDNLGAQVSASARAVLNGTRDLTLLGKLRREVHALS